MAHVADASGTIIRSLNYTGARLHASPDTRKLAKPVKAASKKVRATLDVVKDCDDDRLDAEALEDFAKEELEEGLLALHFKFAGHFESDSAEEVLAVFPKPPKSIVNETTQEKAIEVYGAVSRAANGKHVPAALKPHARRFAALFRKYVAARKAVADAQEAYERARNDEHKAKDAAIVALRQARARLTDKFPKKLKRVARFFLRSAPTKRPGKPEDEPVTPTPAPEE